MLEKTVEYQIKRNTLIYVSTMTIGILIIYSLFSGILLIATGFNEDNFNIWVIGASQVLFMLVPTILAIFPVKLKFHSVFRMNFPGIKFLLISMLGIVFIQLFAEGYVSVQEYLLPQAWRDEYRILLEEYQRQIALLVGHSNLSNYLRSILIIAVIPAISEEFLFRGFLQTTFERNIKIFYAVLIPSVLFGLMHLQPVMFVPLTIVGAYLGIMGYLSSSIIIPVILHFFTNLLSVSSIFFSQESDIYTLTEMREPHIGLILMIVGGVGLFVICYYLFKENLKIKKNLPAENLNNV